MVKYVLTLLTLSVLGVISYGQELEFNKRMSAFVTGSYVPVVTGDNEDVTSPGATASFTDANIRDFITLGIDHHSTLMMGQSYDLEVDVLVTPAAPLPADPAFTITLVIQYIPFEDASYTDKDSYTFQNITEFNYSISEIRVDGQVVTNLPDNAYLDGDIKLRRYYDFTQSLTAINVYAPTLVDLDCFDHDPDPMVEEFRDDEILLTWPTQPGALEYQLEWTFVNNYAATVTASGPTSITTIPASDLNYDFRHNSTRITTTNAHYQIPLLFEQGHLIYRVRAVGEDPLQQGSYVYGAWSIADQGTVQDVINASPNNEKVITAHQEKLNWQVTTTFAEEGKKKEVASYYDGSLRNRQSVTKVNTDNNVIVGETIYDHQGRPAVNVLPVPVQDGGECAPPENDVIKFYPEFNQNSDGNSYNREDFDMEGTTSCSRDIESMNSHSGAAKYYSGNNVNIEGEQAYVPDAGGLPFTVVEYTPDNTGRIRSQSGVGPDFQLGTGHESRYFYGKPDQIQIDRLFGSEVGYAKHYKKNMVIDPNGQISVSYLDQEGRVIATSLAGTPPTNVSNIDSYANALVNVTDRMILPDQDNTTSLGKVNQMELSQTILVTNEGNYEFTYNLSIDNFQDECMLTGVCYSCVYDLKIELVDDCGNVVLDNSTPTPQPVLIEVKEGNFVDNQDGTISFITDCLTPNYSNTHSFIVPLAVGNYNLVKTLTINDEAAQYYLDHYLETDGEFNFDSYVEAYYDPQATYTAPSYVNTDCLMSFEDFLDGYMAEIDTMDCYIDCDACAASLGERDDFILSGGTGEEYDALLSACLAQCEEPTICELAYDMLLADVSPGGQYAEYLDNNGNVNPSFYPLSLMNASNLLPGGSDSWESPSIIIDGTQHTEYLNSDGTFSLIVVVDIGGGNYSPAVKNGVSTQVINGVEYVKPHELANVSDFIDNWKESWAKSLVRHHPEYSYYEICVEYEEEDANGSSSEEFDAELRAMTFQEAVTAGYLTPIGGNGALNGYTVDLSSDPFRTSGYVNHALTGSQALYLDFEDAITNFADIGGTYYKFYEVASIINRCGTSQIGSSTVNASCLLFGADVSGYTIEENDELRELTWNTAVAFYLGKKQELINDYMDQEAIGDNAFNDCIGNPNFNPYASDFYDGSSGTIGSGNPAYSALQPCSFFNKPWFEDKQKRFPDVEMDLNYDENNHTYNIYQQTGLCPEAFNFQAVLDEIAGDGLIQSTSFILKDEIETYTGLILALNDNDFNTAIPADTYHYISSTTTSLSAKITNPSSEDCELSFTTHTGETIDWTKVVGFVNMADVTDMSGVSVFNIVAVVDDQGAISYVNLVGQTCMPIATCNFSQTCELTPVGNELNELMNALLVEGELYNTSYTIPSTYITTLGIGDELEILFGTALDSLTWEYDSVNNTFILRKSASDYLTLNLTSENYQGSFGQADVKYIDNFESNFENYFSYQGFNNGDTLVVSVEGTTTLTQGGTTSTYVIGDCNTPTTCDAVEYQNLEDLTSLIDASFFSGAPNSIDLTAMTMSDNLAFYLDDPSTPTTSSESYVTVGDDNFVTLTIENGECDWIFEMVSNSSTSFANITSVTLIEATGTPSNGNFYEFVLDGVVRVNGIDENVTITATTCIPLQNCDECLGAETSSADFSGVTLINSSNIYLSTTACSTDHTNYGTLRTNFNTYSTNNSLGLSMPSITANDFSMLELCNCYAAFAAHINYIMDNNITSGLTQSDVEIENFCAQAPCTLSLPDLTSYTPSTVPYTNPCVENMLNLAFSNASNAYQDYLDNTSQAFLTDYYSHCNEALSESFEKTYSMNEHHYTLYYYDQAGNLVKTIPPEGVELLGLDNVSDPTGALADQIQADRNASTHTVFTNHRLATKYLYNSLNQLVKQNLPDHDQMDVLDYTLVNGLDANLIIAKVEFVNDNQGFLVGFKKVTLANGDDVQRGYMYKTNDGGHTWTRMSDLVASDINAIQYVTDDIAFAVGNHGLLLKSVDGGSSWDMVDLYAAGVIENLNDLYLVDNAGTISGILVGDDNTVVSYTDGTTPTITNQTITITSVNALYALSAGDNITSVTYDSGASEYVISMTKAGSGSAFGAVYRSSDAISWTAEEDNKVLQLTDVYFLSSTEAFAIGNNGLMLYTSDNGDNWMVTPTGIAENLQGLSFFDDQIGAVVAGGKLYQTIDRGVNFTLVDDSRNYLSLTEYERQSDRTYAMATCDNGEVVRVIVKNNGTVAIDPHEVSAGLGTNQNTMSWASANGSSLAVMTVNSLNEVGFTANYNVGSPNWQAVSNGLAIGIKDIRFVAATGQYDGVFIGTDGYLYEFTFSGTGNFGGVTNLNGVNQYTDLVLDATNNQVLCFNHTLGQVEAYNLTTGTLNTTTPVATISAGSTAASITMDELGGAFHMVGDNGEIYYHISVPNDQTDHVRPLPLNAIEMDGAKVIAAGNNGDVYELNTEGTVIPTSKTTDLNGVAVIASNTSTLVGDAGTIVQFASGAVTNTSTVGNENLNDIVYNNTCDCYVMVGDNNTKYSKATTNWQLLPSNSDVNLNAADLRSDGIYALGGEGSNLVLGAGTFSNDNNQVFSPRLFDISFLDVNRGVISGGLDYFVRRTTNGGGDWNVIAPTSSDLSAYDGRVRMVKETETNTFIGGYSNYLVDVDQATNTINQSITLPGSIASTAAVNDMVTRGDGLAYLVGGHDSSDGYILKSADHGLTWSVLLNSVPRQSKMHLFEYNGTVVTVGDDGKMYYYDGTGIINVSTGTTYDLTDVSFYDDAIGYVSGGSGVLLKTDTYSWNNASDRVFTSLTMASMNLSDQTGGQTNNSLKYVNTVKVLSRDHIFIGGLYNLTTQENYARIMRDESEEYSTHFYYDKLGRIVVSQNSRQYAETPKKYSYTLYDELGRVVEAGEKEENTNLSFNTIFGSTISDHYNPQVIDDTKLDDWINGNGPRREVTHSYYDNVVAAFTLPASFTQNEDNLRKRIGSVTYEDVFDGDDATYDYATHYDYDIHGNVKTLLQDNKKLGGNANPDIAAMQFKRMDYDYDLISGNVHQVAYQEGEADQWIHRYTYDADNRIQSVETSDDGLIWEEDARYFYYDHGPLARVELGENNVQGVDYAYTLQGWLKGVNSDLLDPLNDIGKDGLVEVGQVSSNYLSFNGNDNINCGTSTRGITNQMTIECYIKKTAASGSTQDIAVSKRNTNNVTDWIFVSEYTGSARFTFNGDDGGGSTAIQGTSNIVDGEWHHLAGVIEGDATSSVMKLYVDGVLEGTSSVAGGIVNNIGGNAGLLRIGSMYGYSTTMFNGSIKEVSVWNEARTNAEILNDMDLGLSGSEPGMAAYFKLNEGTGTTVEDLSSYGIDGTFSASPANPTWQQENVDPLPYLVPNANQYIARDAYGFSLDYYGNDYTPINPYFTGSSAFASSITGSDVATNKHDLYNGNIGAMVTTIKQPRLYSAVDPLEPNIHPQATAYQYDQLNRLLEARAFINVDADDQSGTYNTWQTGTTNPDGRYYNKFTYDANGNIETQLRKDAQGDIIDQLTYNYAEDANNEKVQNRLYSVNDIYNYDDADIDDMGTFIDALDKVNLGKYDLDPVDAGNNYKYDATGQLIQDYQEEIANIIWRVDGKIFAIVRHAGSTKSNLVFDYDPMGNRIAKHEYDNDNFPDNGLGSPIYDPENNRAGANWKKSTYYNRDAQGNVMAIYEYFVDSGNSTTHYTLAERNIYGSSRVGMSTDEVEMIAATSTTDHIYGSIGKRQYELSNHLGNVLSVITDKKYPIDLDVDGTIDYYEPDVLLTYDYSPFGVILTERNFDRKDIVQESITPDFRWTFDGGSLVEVNGSGHDASLFNGPVGANDDCNVANNAYLFDGSNDYGVISDHADFDFGAEDFTISTWALQKTYSPSTSVIVGKWSDSDKEFALRLNRNSTGTAAFLVVDESETSYTVSTTTVPNLNTWYHLTAMRDSDSLKIFLNGVLEGAIYIGNAAIDNDGLDMWLAKSGSTKFSNIVIDDIQIFRRSLSQEEVAHLYDAGDCNYQPVVYGGEDVYRYGYQSQEKDDEIKPGEGNSYAYTYRFYDPRLGRFLSIDPLVAQYSKLSPYSFSENKVIQYVELEGAETGELPYSKFYTDVMYMVLGELSRTYIEAKKQYDEDMLGVQAAFSISVMMAEKAEQSGEQSDIEAAVEATEDYWTVLHHVNNTSLLELNEARTALMNFVEGSNLQPETEFDVYYGDLSIAGIVGVSGSGISIFTEERTGLWENGGTVAAVGLSGAVGYGPKVTGRTATGNGTCELYTANSNLTDELNRATGASTEEISLTLGFGGGYINIDGFTGGKFYNSGNSWQSRTYIFTIDVPIETSGGGGGYSYGLEFFSTGFIGPTLDKDQAASDNILFSGGFKKHLKSIGKFNADDISDAHKND